MTIIPEVTLATTPVTFLPNVFKPLIFSDASIFDALNDIKSEKYKEKINYLRSLDKKTYTAEKKLLPAYALNGTFNNSVTNDGFKQSNGLFCVDIDELNPETLEQDKAYIALLPSVFCVFVSTGGKGLKVLLRIPPETVKNNADFRALYTHVEAFFSKHGFTIDPACKDVRRLCFVSHDPNICINWDADLFVAPVTYPQPVKQNPTPYDLKQKTGAPAKQHTDFNSDNESECITVCVNILEKATPGNRHDARLRAGRLAGGFISADRVSEEKITNVLMQVSDSISDGGVTNSTEVQTLRDAIELGKNEPVLVSGSGLNEADDATIKRLSALSPLEYDRLRKPEADRLGVRCSTLDELIAAEQKSNGSADTGLGIDNIEPWAESIEPDQLLNDVAQCIRRFIVCEPETATAAALWVAMTHLIDVVQIAPLAVITAPEKRCGKSQLLSLLGRLVHRPLTASNISPAALFRAIDAWKPTLLIDEADAFMKENEELRGLINCGHTRDSAYIVRVVGEDFTPTKFTVWGAKAISGIGHLADTLMDRAVILELRRKLPHESVERIRHAEPDLFQTLAAKLARFADDYRGQVRDARPHLPEQLNDRAQDNWEPLLAIAGVAGGEWPQLARSAALKLSGSETDAMSIGVELLSDIQEIFDTNKVDKIFTAGLIEALCKDEERPWATYNRGKAISPRQVSSRLNGYGILSKTVRIGAAIKKGYEKDQFQESFNRYLSDTKNVVPDYPLLSVTPLHLTAGAA
jgi:hypothetical protein